MYCFHLQLPPPEKMRTSRRVGRSALRKVSIPPSAPLREETHFNNNVLSVFTFNPISIHLPISIPFPTPLFPSLPPHSQAASTLSVSQSGFTRPDQQSNNAATQPPTVPTSSFSAFPHHPITQSCHLLGWCPSGRSHCPGSLGVSYH